MTAVPPEFKITTSRQFPAWLAESGISLAFTTYQAGKLFFVGTKPEGGISLAERTIARCMGMTVSGNSIYVSSLYQLWRFENVLEPGQLQDGYDRLYVPQVGYITGDLDIHDLAIDAQGRVVFTNTLFGCLATTSETHSFIPIWKPPFLSRLAAEDRCHLNGLAMDDGVPRYMTAVGETDVADGWRDHRQDGGVLIDVQKNEVVAGGFSMPHSPRVYKDKVWLHNSGTGFFGYADIESGKFEEVAFCPGYLRGLAFHKDIAVMGLSKPRKGKGFSGLALDNNVAERKVEPRCGIYFVDINSGDVVHWLRIEGIVEELYDVAVLPGVKQPLAIGFVSEEIRRVLRVGEPQWLGE